MQNVSGATFSFPGQTGFYRGKVRDVYFMDDLLVVVASDRISAFDHILPKPIPFKGQVLNQLASHFLKASSDIVPNWLIGVPDPNVSVGLRCEPIKIEMVIRGYLAGHAWREYKSGKRTLCGVTMPDGMRESDPFPEPIITPATKADEGHDEDISREDILKKGIVSAEVYSQLEEYTRGLFALGTEMAKERGLILVDTKYEFGMKDGKIYLIDEIHTPDSSRYYYLDGYAERQETGEKQKQLSKEFVREWLMANGFQGLDGQMMPHMPQDFVELVAQRYIELYEHLTGQKFVPAPQENVHDRIEQAVVDFLQQIRDHG
jgi:phosphoribosylaminoimidazole-succinocarboxamide synthase